MGGIVLEKIIFADDLIVQSVWYRSDEELLDAARNFFLAARSQTNMLISTLVLLII